MAMLLESATNVSSFATNVSSIALSLHVATPSLRRLGEVVLALPPPPSPPPAPAMNWFPIVLVLVLAYLGVMALVIASVFCWRQQQPRASEKTSLTGNQNPDMPTAAPARPIYQDNSTYYSDRGDGRAGWATGYPTHPRARPLPPTQQQKMEFVRKVYAILSTQLLVTVLICVGLVAVSFENWDASKLTSFGSGLLQAAFVLVLVSLIPMMILLCVIFYQKNSYPMNFILLGLFTLLESFIVGLFCVLYYAGGYGARGGPSTRPTRAGGWRLSAPPARSPPHPHPPLASLGQACRF